MTEHPTSGEQWKREEWEGEGQDDLPHDTAPDHEVEHWRKEQWEGEGQDEEALETHEPVEEMGEGDSEFSGHGHNPGGGQRWADVDSGE